MRWLLDEEEIDRSPMERMRPPIVPEKPVPVLTEAQLRALLASAKSTSFVDRRDAAIKRLLLDTGGRLSEVAGLAVADLDFTEDVAHVIGKGRRPRALPFGQQAGLALGRYQRARGVEVRQPGRVISGVEAAFSSDDPAPPGNRSNRRRQALPAACAVPRRLTSAGRARRAQQTGPS
jgi:site-specific recombinase XerD